MTAKVIEMPKSNQQLWDDLFNGFQNQIDRRQAQLRQELVNLDDLGIQPPESVYEREEKL